MTTVNITKKDGHIEVVDCSGHTGYAREGEDIVCAALSSVVQTALLGLLQVAGINVDYSRNDNEGALKFAVSGLTQSQRHDADMILETMLCGIADLSESFSDFVQLIIK